MQINNKLVINIIHLTIKSLNKSYILPYLSCIGKKLNMINYYKIKRHYNNPIQKWAIVTKKQTIIH